ncbi:MAG: SDR family oxidoreductase [Myxococcota bacterium]|nr:SDR family oxidoreductase [Myxococcota bacterium]
MSASLDLKNQTAIVTGASSGIGRAIAESLGAAGAEVLLAGRTAEPMEISRKKIEEAGGRAHLLLNDIREVSAVQGLVDTAMQKTGRLDIMVNNAGVEHPASIIDGQPEEWREMLETNVLALIVGCQAAVRAMRSCGAEGKIINISSVASQRRDPGVYGATKHAVNAISGSLRTELEGDTIRVTTVLPGATVTNFARNFSPEFTGAILKMAGSDLEPVRGQRVPDEVLDQVSGLLKERFADPVHIANAVLYVVRQPIEINIEDIVVRPPHALNLKPQ